MATAESLRQKHMEATRRRLRHAAMDLFSEHGFSATTVDDIAARADVSPRTFFRYFATKEAVLFEDADVRLSDVARLVAQRPADESPIDALLSALYQATDNVVSDPAYRRLLQRIAPDLPHLRAQRTATTDGLERDLLAALATRTGTSTDDLHLRAVVAAVTACVDVAMRAWIEHGADEAFRPYLEETIEACATAFATKQHA
ncbi:MAG: TetR family transcriptional regulator [Acidimicrobiia bacterium]